MIRSKGGALMHSPFLQRDTFSMEAVSVNRLMGAAYSLSVPFCTEWTNVMLPSDGYGVESVSVSIRCLQEPINKVQ